MRRSGTADAGCVSHNLYLTFYGLSFVYLFILTMFVVCLSLLNNQNIIFQVKSELRVQAAGPRL